MSLYTIRKWTITSQDGDKHEWWSHGITVSLSQYNHWFHPFAADECLCLLLSFIGIVIHNLRIEQINIMEIVN